MIDKEYTFTVTGDDGEQVLCDALAVIHRNEENAHTVLIYTDYTLDENEKIKIYVSEIVKENFEMKLNEIDEETYEEIPQVMEALKQIWDNNLQTA